MKQMNANTQRVIVFPSGFIFFLYTTMFRIREEMICAKDLTRIISDIGMSLHNFMNREADAKHSPVRTAKAKPIKVFCCNFVIVELAFCLYVTQLLTTRGGFRVKSYHG